MKFILYAVLFALVACQSTTDYATKDHSSGGEIRGNEKEISEISNRRTAEGTNGKIKIIKSVYPKYPKDALDAGIEGQVVVEFIVNEKGKVEKGYVVRSAGRLLDTASVDAVLKWRFEPILENGEPVVVKFREPFTFKLD